jgi:hypothetical protein
MRWVGRIPQNHQNGVREAERGKTKEGDDNEEEFAESERVNAD